MGVLLWAVLGVALTFAEAILRLGTLAFSTLAGGLSTFQWGVLVSSTLGLTYVEGYRALQRRFAPALIARAATLDARRPQVVLLAPLYALSLLGADARSTARAYVGVALIVLAVVLVRALPSPWRGIADTAVAVALSWGLVTLLLQLRAFLATRR